MVGMLCMMGVVADWVGEWSCFLLVLLLWITLTIRGWWGLMLVDCASSWFWMVEDRCCWVVIVVVWPCLLICSDLLVSFSVVFVGFCVCV